MSSEQMDLVIVGGGPAGMNAAIEARRAGVKSVCILDEGVAPGGQIFRRYGPGFSVIDAHAAGHEYEDGQALIEEARTSGAEIRSSTVVWGIWDKRIAYVSDDTKSGTIDAKAIVIATGARDRPVAFSGWTLPGVFTAGAAKTLVAIQRVLPGKRILMAGSGPLALAFSAQLREYGANIVEVVEAAPRPRPLALARLAIDGDPAILRDAAKYRAQLFFGRVPFSYSTIIARVEGHGEVERAVVAKVDRGWRILPGNERTIDVDTVLLGYGLESSSELSRLVGCQQHFSRNFGGWLPVKDDCMRTSVPGVFAAGDGSGVGGAKHAVEEGRIAGIMAARDLGVITESEAARRAVKPFGRLRRMKRFLKTLNEIYAVGPGLYELATPDTIICRCEERTAAELDATIGDDIGDPNLLRALSRIGMGRCQGRNCSSHVAAAIARRTGRAVEEIAPGTVRPPVKPVSVAAIAEERFQHDSEVVIA
jgi:D-hydroxyproline dehydrogenase subunit alpha